MITVYVESNFVLEIVLEQEQSDACAKLLRMRQVDLAIPLFALIEPELTLRNLRAKRTELTRSLENELGYIERTRSLATEVSNLKSVFTKAAQGAASRYADARRTLLKRARLLSLDGAVWKVAEHLHADGMQLPDALMLATVLVDRKRTRRRACFVNRNFKDFAAYKDRLEKTNCRLIASFEDGLSFAAQRPRISASQR